MPPKKLTVDFNESARMWQCEIDYGAAGRVTYMDVDPVAVLEFAIDDVIQKLGESRIGLGK